jgi:hypothetical protein
MRALTHELASKVMLDAGLVPLVDYPGNKIPWRCYRSACGHEVTPTRNSIARGVGACRYCAPNAPVGAPEQVMLNVGLTPLERYPGSDKPWRCRHEACGREVAPKRNSIIQGQGGCRFCAEHGFDHTSPAYLYLLVSADNGSAKIGITGSGSRRLDRHAAKGWTVEFLWLFNRGADAHAMEQAFIRWLDDHRVHRGVVHPNLMPQRGWTETWSLLHLSIETAKSVITEMIDGGA